MLDEEGRWRVEAKASLWLTFHSFSEKQHKAIGNDWQLDSPQKAALSLVCPLRRGPVAATHCPWSCWCLTSYINCISSFLSEAGVGVPGKSQHAVFMQEYSLFSGESLHFNRSVCVSAAQLPQAYSPRCSAGPSLLLCVPRLPTSGACRMPGEQRSLFCLSLLLLFGGWKSKQL